MTVKAPSGKMSTAVQFSAPQTDLQGGRATAGRRSGHRFPDGKGLLKGAAAGRPGALQEHGWLKASCAPEGSTDTLFASVTCNLQINSRDI